MDQNNQDQIHLTIEGLNQFKKELADLKEEKRPKLVDRLATARESGDEPDNQEYNQAKEALAMLDGRIEELEDILAKAVIIKQSRKSGASGEVALGSQVTVDLDGNEIVFHLVGEWEADPMEQKVSHKSPLGQKLIGKKAGEEVEVEAPVGKLVYKIVKIE